jgi:hypothetical protein
MRQTVDPEHLVGEGKGGVTYGKRGLELLEGAAGHRQLLERRDSPAPVLTFAIN